MAEGQLEGGGGGETWRVHQRGTDPTNLAKMS